MSRWPHTDATRAAIAANLAAHGHRPGDEAGRRRAAVSIVLAPSESGSALLLTRRATRLKRHSGQYALPGGRLDAGESPLEAALRELQEELGVLASAAHLLGRLDDLPTASGFLVSPFVLWLDDPAFCPDPAEVAAVFRVPLPELFAESPADAPRRIALEPQALWLYLPTLGHEVYAPTAAMLFQFREVALLGRRVPMPAFREPGFARR